MKCTIFHYQREHAKKKYTIFYDQIGGGVKNAPYFIVKRGTKNAPYSIYKDGCKNKFIICHYQRGKYKRKAPYSIYKDGCKNEIHHIPLTKWRLKAPYSIIEEECKKKCTIFHYQRGVSNWNTPHSIIKEGVKKEMCHIPLWFQKYLL